MGFPFNQVAWPAGSDNMGGIATRAFFCPARSFTAWPGWESADSVVLDLSKATYLKDEGFIEIYVTYNSGGISAEPVGDTDGVCSKQSGEFFHPGSTEEMARFARAVQNTPGVFVFQDTQGRYRVVGDVVNPAKVTAKHETGKKAEDRNGWTISFEAYSTRPVVFAKPGADASKPPFTVVGGTATLSKP